jgi:hypothetical protein
MFKKQRKIYDLSLFLKYVEFCISERSFRVLERSFALFLRLNKNKIIVFSLAAFFEYENGRGIIEGLFYFIFVVVFYFFQPDLYYITVSVCIPSIQFSFTLFST